MSSIVQNRDAVELLAEEFLARYRRGERPSVSDYEEQHPDLAREIGRLFPALIVLEQLGASANPAVERLVPAGLTHIGEYRILREVGRGGMGVVFEAEQESLGRHVALKVLPPALCRDKYLERFQREAKAAARLHHTNIVPVFGVGVDAGLHFYVMQFIDGRGLDRVLKHIRLLRSAPSEAYTNTLSDDKESSHLASSLISGASPLPIAEPEARDAANPSATEADLTGSAASGDAYYQSVARVGQQVAEALHYAHSQGVLHRDVKPSNLLLASGGTVWVADFGLAKADDSEDLTDTGDLVGTLRYMAPERLQGHCDARSDIHGLGVTLFELLALRPAFDAPGRIRLLDQVARGAAPRLRQLVPDIPRDLEMIVSKAMAREPADRYSSARDLADDLDCYLGERPVRARRLPVVERLSRWCRRHPTVAALTTTIIVLLVCGAVGGWWAAARLGFEVQAVRQAEEKVTDRLWDARLAQAQAGRASRLPGQRFASLAAVAEAAQMRPSRDLRNEAVACMALSDVRIEREWDADLETTRLAFSTGVAFDPTLEHHACTSANGTIFVRATTDGKLEARLTGLNEPADFLQFSPDGRYLAARAIGLPAHPCRVWDWRAGKVVVERPTSSSYVLGIDFRADSSALVLENGSNLETVALPSGQILGVTRLDFAPGWLAVGPGKSNLAAVAGHMAGKLQVLDLADSRVVANWDDIPTEMVAVAWHPNGELLAASGRDGNLYIFDLASRPQQFFRRLPGDRYGVEQATHAPPVVLHGHSLEARELSFSPDGALLISRGWDSTTRLWDPLGGRELLRIQGVSFIRFDQQGQRLAFRGYNSKRLGIWEFAERSVCRVLHDRQSRSPQAQAGVSFSPDNRLLAASAGEGVTLWDVASGRLLGRLPTSATTDVLFDPAGRYLYTTGDRGFVSWPLSRSIETHGVHWQIDKSTPGLGAIRRLLGYQMHADREGNRLAVVERFNRVIVASPADREGSQLVLHEHPQVSSAALSPDGRFAATGTWRGTGVKVWDASNGESIRDISTAGSAGVGFSPDGSHLLLLEPSGAYRGYRVGTWKQEWERSEDRAALRGLRAAFHPNGRIMAHVMDRVNMRLVDLETGEPLAVLPVPESENLSGYQFSPNGRYLAAITVRGAVQLWDLSRLRAGLRELGLDWEPRERGEIIEPDGSVFLEVRN